MRCAEATSRNNRTARGAHVAREQQPEQPLRQRLPALLRGRQHFLPHPPLPLSPCKHLIRKSRRRGARAEWRACSSGMLYPRNLMPSSGSSREVSHNIPCQTPNPVGTGAYQDKRQGSLQGFASTHTA